MRSRPAPVSMLGRGRGSTAPSTVRLYCMKTRFQISTNRSCPAEGRPAVLPVAGALVEEELRARPRGPVSPMFQKLSSPRRWMRSAGTPTASRQICSASSSLSWTVIHSRSPSMPRTSVTSSQAKGMASALK